MKITILAVASALSIIAGTAFAGEGNGSPFPFQGTAQIVANSVANDTGSQATPSFSGPSVIVTAGGTLPTNGSQSAVQTANSLPRGFEGGTVAYAQAESVSRYLVAQAAHTQTAHVQTGRLAQVQSGQPQG